MPRGINASPYCPHLIISQRVNQVKRGSFAIQAFDVVYPGSSRLGGRSYIVHPARSARGSRRGRIGVGEKDPEKQKKVGVGV
ncbi:hypothetical protein B0H14DRAFT_3870294 [Mycena olivaceomarginata]|nr:hypothetical protein B0H14DRAFT_3870294 [Mycena olivaceomarginata]